MTDSDQIAVLLSSGILRASEHEIEALTLEAIATDGGSQGLDAGLTAAMHSDQRGGAFGMEIIGASLAPIVVDAVRTFWKQYSEEFIKKMGTSAADATAAHLKRWFTQASPKDKYGIADGLAASIRAVGAERGLVQADIDALVAATAPDKLGAALAGG